MRRWSPRRAPSWDPRLSALDRRQHPLGGSCFYSTIISQRFPPCLCFHPGYTRLLPGCVDCIKLGNEGGELDDFRINMTFLNL